MARHFRATGHLRQVHRITLKWHWTVNGQMLLQLHTTTTHESQVSTSFVLRPAIFELQTILRQVHRMALKSFWATKGPRYPIDMLQLPSSPKFQSVSLLDQPFLVTDYFETSAPNDHQKTLNNKEWKAPYTDVAISSESQPSIHFALRPALFELKAILRQVHRMTPK